LHLYPVGAETRSLLSSPTAGGWTSSAEVTVALVAWILALGGAVLAFALCAGSASGLGRRMDRASAIAVTPLPLMAVYFTANDLLALVRAGPPYQAWCSSVGHS
jgi:hypothetical protein